MFKLSAVQLTSTTNVQANLASISKQLGSITSTGNDKFQKTQHLVVLPECCLFFGGKEQDQLALAKESALDNILPAELAKLAKQFSVYLVAGTIPVLTAAGDKFTNTSFLFSPDGEMLGQYDKIHLFDANVSDNTKSYQESLYTQAGEQIRVINTPLANIGLSVCFDLRFPLLFQQLLKQGADIITVPSAFTKLTGKAHWQALLQARAIENQVYIIASGQEGTHENGRETWGHSMIINPWGEIEQKITTGEGYVSVDYHQESLLRIRNSMPLKSPLA